MKLTTRRNTLLELTFHGAQTRQDPYHELELDLVLTTPDGSEMRIPCFWAGDSVWKARFAGSEAGHYAGVTVCSDPQDSGLHGQTVEIEVQPYAGSNPLYTHGRLRVAEDRRHFEHADGTPFFWLGDTWWMGLSERCDWPRGFRLLTTDRVGKGFSVVQMVVGPYPDMDSWDPRGRNEAGFPFTDGYERVNPSYYDHADLKILHLVHNGLVPCLVGMWGYYLPKLGLERVKRFWRMIVARYGALPVTWCIAGEGAMPFYLTQDREGETRMQREGWAEVMRYVRSLDPYRNLITIHPTNYGRDQVTDDSLMDFEMLQTGHGDFDSIPPTIQMVRTACAREPRMPVINSEVNYEGILGRSYANVQRLCFYHSVLNGTAGHTYGANGIWQMNGEEKPYGPSPHGRSWGSTSWEQAADLPGSAQMGFGRRILSSLPWWELDPHPEWLGLEALDTQSSSLIATGIPGRLRVVYVPFCWDPPAIHGLDDGHAYMAAYADPCTGRELEIGAVTPDDAGRWTAPPPPEVHDWLIILRAR